MSKTILIVEDEKPILDILKFNIQKEGYNVVTAQDGVKALEMEQKHNPDLILLDVMLPELDGFEVCSRIREHSNTPIIMLTALGDETDKIKGLELGADDYITKPFSVRELFARIKANTRRSASEMPMNPSDDDIAVFNDIKINLDRYEVYRDGKPIDLTLREFELLKFLATKQDKVFSREALLEKVWGYEFFGDVRTVDVTVRRLREKLEIDPSSPKYVITKRGVGYYFTNGEIKG